MAQSEYDVVVIGAGAAGLAATRTLAGAPISSVLLEARSRIGGRAHTVAPWRNLPLDLGPEWLHSADRNLLARVIEAAGFAIDRTPPHWMRQSGNVAMSAQEQADFRAASEAFRRRLEAAADQGEEGPAAAWLAPGCRWNALIDAISSYYNGAEYDQVSLQDYLAYDESGVSWRVVEGYGAALAAVADVEAQVDCAVSRVDHSGARVIVSTPHGELSARAVIITLPTSLIADGALAFSPDLPAKRAAAEGLPLGLADKVFLALDEPEALPLEGHLFGHADRAETGSYNTRPFGRPLIEGYFGGRCADALERDGEGALAAFAMDELAGLLGSGVRATIRPIVATAWRRDPWTLGSYSHALPGRSGERAVLAEPVDDRLFFAGEACSTHLYSTVHGAWQTGEVAALRALAALGAPLPGDG
jgi:monoamine oxidase